MYISSLPFSTRSESSRFKLPVFLLAGARLLRRGATSCEGSSAAQVGVADFEGAGVEARGPRSALPRSFWAANGDRVSRATIEPEVWRRLCVCKSDPPIAVGGNSQSSPLRVVGCWPLVPGNGKSQPAIAGQPVTTPAAHAGNVTV